MTDLERLAPCPFCGSSDVILEGIVLCDHEFHYVKCRLCVACGPHRRNAEDATWEWNKREGTEQMSEYEPTEQALEYKPTLSDRFWKQLGYRYHLADDLVYDEKKFYGWMRTELKFNFGILDRLRLLLSGKLKIDLTQHTTCQVDETINETSWIIDKPRLGKEKST